MRPGPHKAWQGARTQDTICLVQPFGFRSVAQSYPSLCNPMNRSTPGLPVHHPLPEFTQTHVHPVGDAIQPPYPLSSPSPPAPNPSQHQSFTDGETEAQEKVTGSLTVSSNFFFCKFQFEPSLPAPQPHHTASFLTQHRATSPPSRVLGLIFVGRQSVSSYDQSSSNSLAWHTSCYRLNCGPPKCVCGSHHAQFLRM